MLWILPLEPLLERYTKQWMRWFADRLEARFIEYDFLLGAKLTDQVETGTVLDAEGTNYWKFTQMQRVCEAFKYKVVKDGDKFFTFDMWHPGLEAIPYMAQLEGIHVDVYAFLHAGSYTIGDFAEPMTDWASHFERAWFRICKTVFVGSQYHRNAFVQRRWDPCSQNYAATKIRVTGNPFNSAEIRATMAEHTPVAERRNVIIFPHRWDKEKDPIRFVRLMDMLWEKRKDFEVVVTTSRPGKMKSNDPEALKLLRQYYWTFGGAAWFVLTGLTKQQYYQQLAQAKVMVSTTIEENFGYCLVEALAMGCEVVVPDKFSHPEIVPGGLLYHSDEEAVRFISSALDTPVSRPELAERFDGSVDRILDEILI